MSSGNLVLDASAGLRVILSPADHRRWARRLQGAAAVIAPTLYATETANALWKYHQAGKIDSSELTGLHSQALALITDWLSDFELLPEALLLAARASHPVYDCVYLTCCRRFGAQLLTADRPLGKLAKRIQSAP